MSKRLLAALLAVLAATFALTACGSSAGDNADTPAAKDTGTDGEKSKSQEETDKAESCDGFTAGADDVVRTFCDGTAKVDLTVGGDDYTLSGGDCATEGGYFTVNIGVVTDSGFSGTKPDYFGSNMPEADGDYGESDQAFATFAVDGQEYSVPKTTGTHDADSATFSGTTTDGDIAVTGTVTC
ncbi:MAG TPA: hypothetical protein VNQ33_05185 [Acidimicrobiales bacterium]|nr:hypothetical protein [Acidimicrobiales bacterium]